MAPGNPVIKIRCWAWDMETFAGCIGKLLVLHGKNDFIQYIHIQILDDTFAWNVTETGNLIFNCFV